ncbi:MerR family transcriptional regulator, partial [Actinomadura sp. 7K534]|uniref:helix-turn-helix domain-containing protein n=1 Tax=Actinomadura sp. 7K534 TaxID=2530366 RepID=UPI001A9EEED3
MEGTWTISELAERAAAALAADGSTQVSGRVRDVPNERLIRWYTTIGLVDPPLGRRGRTALYGPRHLLQLVAVKRRQAAGLSIAQIQVELTGATDATLERIAALPYPAPQPPRGRGTAGRAPRPPAPSTPAPSDRPAAPAGRPAHLDFDDIEPAPPANSAAESAPLRPEDGAPSASPPGDEHDTAHSAFWRVRPDISYTEAAVADDYGAGAPAEPRPTVVQGVRLTPGLTLLLDVPALD